MSLDKSYCIYRHLKPNGEVFYIGVSNNLKRPYNKTSRSKQWKKLVKEYPNYEIQILKTALTKETAYELEIILINWYKRKDCCEGTLVNLTDGGESTKGRIMENWQKEFMSNSLKGTMLGENNPNYGNRWTNEQKRYMSEIKKEGYRNGSLKVDLNNSYKGVEERNKRWEENPNLKYEMRKKVSECNNKYEYLKIDRNTLQILEVFQNRLEIFEKYPEYKTSPLLSTCNGWKGSYKGFLWRYRDRETGFIIEPERKY